MQDNFVWLSGCHLTVTKLRGLGQENKGVKGEACKQVLYPKRSCLEAREETGRRMFPSPPSLNLSFSLIPTPKATPLIQEGALVAGSLKKFGLLTHWIIVLMYFKILSLSELILKEMYKTKSSLWIQSPLIIPGIGLAYQMGNSGRQLYSQANINHAFSCCLLWRRYCCYISCITILLAKVWTSRSMTKAWQLYMSSMAIL